MLGFIFSATSLLKTSHFSVYVLLSKTSGAIQAALPFMLVITVDLSQAVPKSHICCIRLEIKSSREMIGHILFNDLYSKYSFLSQTNMFFILQTF